MSSSEIPADLPGTSAALPAQSIGTARLLIGATAFKDEGIPNQGDTYRAQILTSDGVRNAIVKDMPLRGLANELMAAALALEIGLPVPPAFLVAADDKVLATQHAPKEGTVSFLFGSADLKSPSVAQIVITKLGLDAAGLGRVIDALVSSGKLGNLYGFDAWSANTDRHLGNILLGSNALPWLIDHGRCFTGENWAPADLVAEQMFTSRLKGWLTPRLSAAQKGEYAKEAAELAVRLAAIDVREAGTKNGLSELYGENDFNALVTFLCDRVVHTPRIASDSLQLVI
jgi:hypothetical protein